jgi:hypothetical protein
LFHRHRFDLTTAGVAVTIAFKRRMQWRYRDLQLHSAITRRWLIIYLNCNTWTSINPGSILFLF